MALRQTLLAREQGEQTTPCHAWQISNMFTQVTSRHKQTADHHQTLNWNEIAKICDTTPGAASKRYSRMKQPFEAGGGPPGSNPTSPTPKTPSKKTQAAATDNEATPTPKRKRASPKKKIVGQNEVEIKPEQESDEDEDMLSPKKAKVNGKANVEEGPDVPLPTTETTTLVKNEVEDHVEDIFIDAKQWVDDLVEHGDVTEDEGQATRKLFPASPLLSA